MAVAVATLTSACGGGAAPPAPVVSCPLVTGAFTTYATLEATEGSCPLAKETSKDSISFDKKGAFVSPLEGLVWCTTVQEDCELHVRCTTSLVRAKGEFDGRLAVDGDGLHGLAVLSGSYQGCFEVRYRVDAKRK